MTEAAVAFLAGVLFIAFVFTEAPPGRLCGFVIAAAKRLPACSSDWANRLGPGLRAFAGAPAAPDGFGAATPS